MIVKISLDKHRACRTHCCILHGCKYGHEDCPVVTAKIKQKYLCEYCYDDVNDIFFDPNVQRKKLDNIFLKENRKLKLNHLNTMS